MSFLVLIGRVLRMQIDKIRGSLSNGDVIYRVFTKLADILCFGDGFLGVYLDLVLCFWVLVLCYHSSVTICLGRGVS